MKHHFISWLNWHFAKTLDGFLLLSELVTLVIPRAPVIDTLLTVLVFLLIRQILLRLALILLLLFYFFTLLQNVSVSASLNALNRETRIKTISRFVNFRLFIFIHKNIFAMLLLFLFHFAVLFCISSFVPAIGFSIEV